MRTARQIWKERPALTGRGRVLLAASAMLLLLGLIIADEALIRIGCFWLFLLAIALPLSFLNLTRISFSIDIPDSAFQQIPFPITMELHNSEKKLDTFDVDVRCEAGTGEKAGHAFFNTVLGLHSYELEASATLNRRGIYSEFSYALTSRFPLGLALHGKHGKADRRLVIYPSPRLPPDLQNIMESQIGNGRSKQSASGDISGEFRLMREYLPGDHAKLISWPTSSRTRRLVVKETEHPGPQELTIIFHSLQPPGIHLSRKSFERSLQLLSGLLMYFTRNFIPVEFISVFNSWEKISVNDPASLKLAMESLAGAAPVIARTQSSLNQIVTREARRSLSLLIVSNTPIKHWMGNLPEVSIPLLCMDNGEASAL